MLQSQCWFYLYKLLFCHIFLACGWQQGEGCNRQIGVGAGVDEYNVQEWELKKSNSGRQDACCHYSTDLCFSEAGSWVHACRDWWNCSDCDDALQRQRLDYLRDLESVGSLNKPHGHWWDVQRLTPHLCLAAALNASSCSFGPQLAIVSACSLSPLGGDDAAQPNSTMIISCGRPDIFRIIADAVLSESRTWVVEMNFLLHDCSTL